MEYIKNIYHLQNTIEKNTQYFLRPKNAALSSLLEPYSQLPRLNSLNSQQILNDIENKRKLSQINLQKLSTQRRLTRILARSQTIEEPAMRKASDIILSCEKMINEHKKQLPEFQTKIKYQDEYKAIKKADELHKLIEKQIYQCNKEDVNRLNKRAISYIQENSISIDKDRFLQKCNRERFQLQQYREKPQREKELKRFKTNYHDF